MPVLGLLDCEQFLTLEGIDDVDRNSQKFIEAGSFFLISNWNLLFFKLSDV